MVTSVSEANLGWWVQAIAQRRTLSGAPQQWLTFPRERHEAAQVTRFFELGGPTDAGMRYARSVGASQILLVRSTPFYPARAVAAWTRRHPPLFTNRDVVLLSVPPESTAR